MHQQRLAESLARFEQVFESSPNAYLLLAPDFTILACNLAYEAQAGRSRADLVGRSLFEFFPVAHPLQREKVEASLAWVFRERRRHTIPMLRYAVGHVAKLENDSLTDRYWTVTHVPLLNDAGEVDCVLSHPTEITELTRLRHAEEEPGEEASGVRWARGMAQMLSAERNYLQQLFKQAPGFIAVSRGPEHVFELANDAFYQLIGHREVLNQPLIKALPEMAEQAVLKILDRVYAQGEPWTGRAVPLSLQREANAPLESRYIDLVFQPIRESGGEVSGIFMQGHDVTEVHELGQQVAYQAAHDPLTGLFNRRELARRVAALCHAEEGARGEAAAGGEAGGTPHLPRLPVAAPTNSPVFPTEAEAPPAIHALLYLDLDQFKIVNDQWGHAAGDELLRCVAAVLQRHVRSSDILARVGGDEFALVLTHCPEGAAEQAAAHLREQIAALDFVWEGQSYGISASVGVAAFGPALKVRFEVALSQADAACFLAKEKGRDRVQIYRSTDDDLYRQHRDMSWVTRLHECMAQDRVVLYAQPIVGLQAPATGEQVWEVLARLRVSDSLVMPTDFIPAAERFGLMPALDRHIIDKAFAHLHGLPAAQRERTRYFINVSGNTLNQEALPTFVESLLERYPQVRPEQVCFEVTETAAVSNLAVTARAMQQLVDRGFRFALDDFGSGMASFSYLRKLPVQYVKIDGEFVRRILLDPVDDAVVQAIAKVVHVMKVQAVAEFVESEAIRARLVVLGVAFGQGYALGMPRPLENIEFGPTL